MAPNPVRQELLQQQAAHSSDLGGDPTPSTSLCDLPIGALAHLSEHLRAHEVVVLRGVCRSLQQATEELWTAIVQRVGGLPRPAPMPARAPRAPGRS